MDRPQFLTLEEVRAIHQDQVSRYGGDPGVRDQGLLASALAMPRAGVGESYVHADLFAMAAAYLFHIVRNHPFVDGNKRTGIVAALIFLEMNNVMITADNDILEGMVWSVAQDGLDKEQIASWFRKHAK